MEYPQTSKRLKSNNGITMAKAVKGNQRAVLNKVDCVSKVE